MSTTAEDLTLCCILDGVVVVDVSGVLTHSLQVDASGNCGLHDLRGSI